jgi:hypothetical protein
VNVDYIGGQREQYRGLTKEEAAKLAAEKIADPTVERVEVFTNRRERRRDAAIARKQNRKDKTSGPA